MPSRTPSPEFVVLRGPTHGHWSPFVLGSALLALLVIAGYGAFRLFVAGGASLIQEGYVFFAIVAGVGAFFSPCSFPLLPSYLAYAPTIRMPERRLVPWLGLLEGSAAAAGIVSFNLVLGGILALAGLGLASSFSLIAPSPAPTTVLLRIGVAGFLIAFGALQIADVSLHGPWLDRVLRWIAPVARLRRPLVDLYVYGFAYTVTGIGCTAPFLATVVVVALASGGPLAAFAAFLAFSMTMAALMLLISVIGGTARRGALASLTRRTPTIKRGAGAVLVAFGMLLAVLSVWPSLLRPLFP
jgi:cytochrome c-type biogenesis protein